MMGIKMKGVKIKTNEEFISLAGKVLVATPFAMEGNVFHQSVIYMVKHTKDGAVGLISNHLVKNRSAKELFLKLDSNLNIDNLSIDTYLGGPVDIEHGFFLHSNEYNNNLLFAPSENGLVVSSNMEILSDIAQNKGPKNTLFTIGYTGWDAGQLESEIEKNLWIVTEPNNDIIFLNDPAQKWHLYLNSLGISKSDFIPGSASC